MHQYATHSSSLAWRIPQIGGAWWATVHGVAELNMTERLTSLSLYFRSAYKSNKQGDNIQPWRTPFLIWNQSVFQCPVLIAAYWPAHRFLRRQVRWSGIPISWRIFQFFVIYTVKGFGVINKAEVDVFLELSCFFDDPMDVGNLISGSSVFSKFSLNIWKFTTHVLLKPGLKNFEHILLACKMSAIVW